MPQHGWWLLIRYKNRSNNIFNIFIDEQVQFDSHGRGYGKTLMFKIYIKGARKYPTT